MPDDAPKRRVSGFDVVALVGLVVGAVGLVVACVNTYFQFFHSRDSVLLIIRDHKLQLGDGAANRFHANFVFVNSGTGQATVLDFHLHTFSEDKKSEYSPSRLRTEYDDQQRQLPFTIGPGATKVVGVKLPFPPTEHDQPIAERMFVYLNVSAVTASGRVMQSRHRLFKFSFGKDGYPRNPETQVGPHQLFVKGAAAAPPWSEGGRVYREAQGK